MVPPTASGQVIMSTGICLLLPVIGLQGDKEQGQGQDTRRDSVSWSINRNRPVCFVMSPNPK